MSPRCESSDIPSPFTSPFSSSSWPECFGSIESSLSAAWGSPCASFSASDDMVVVNQRSRRKGAVEKKLGQGALRAMCSSERRARGRDKLVGYSWMPESAAREARVAGGAEKGRHAWIVVSVLSLRRQLR